jgi:CheY-like chemotaxis protein
MAGAFLRSREAGAVNHSVLYIEDERDNVVLVEMILRRRPQIELHVAMTGRDGVRAAIEKQPGLILLDNRLPDASGGEILRELTSAPGTAAIPVVVLSSDLGEITDKLVASGAAEAVTKPLDVHQFVAMIDRYLS